MVHVTRDELESMGIYEDIGKLEESVEQLEEDVDNCGDDSESAFYALVWIGKLLKAIFAK